MRLFQWKAVFMAVFLLGLAGSAQAASSAGEIIRVDVNAHKVYFRDHTVVEVGSASRLFDREGHRMEFSDLAASVDRFRSQGAVATGDMPYARYKTVDSQGNLIVEELYLMEVPR